MKANIDNMAKILWSGCTVNYGTALISLAEAEKQSARQKAALYRRFGDIQNFKNFLMNQDWLKLIYT